jgi:vacuolar-type H+-ATPase subunit I/STV1
MKIVKTILIVLFFLFITYWIVFQITPASDIADRIYNKIDSLNHNIDSLTKQNKKLDSAIANYTNQIDTLDSNINKIKNQKTIIKEIYHETITNVDNYNGSQLDSFFSKRYYQQN